MQQSHREQIKRKLELQREEALQSISRVESEKHSLDLDSAKDSADRCVTSLSNESLFERSSQRRTILRLIDAVLRRIAEGSFGVCVTCGEVIQDRRLEALPWTQFCLRCQEVIEEEVGENVVTRIPPAAVEMWKRVG
jgi:DnaK suppressor protein